MHKGPGGGFPGIKELDQAEDACKKALGISPDDLTSVVSLEILVKKAIKRS